MPTVGAMKTVEPTLGPTPRVDKVVAALAESTPGANEVQTVTVMAAKITVAVLSDPEFQNAEEMFVSCFNQASDDEIETYDDFYLLYFGENEAIADECVKRTRIFEIYQKIGVAELAKLRTEFDAIDKLLSSEGGERFAKEVGNYDIAREYASIRSRSIAEAANEEKTEVNPTAALVPPTTTAEPEPTETPAEEAMMEGQGIRFEPGEVAREDTLILFHGGSEGRYIDHELWNPYAIGANHQQGPNLIFEPLAFYSAFADKEIMWLAESYSYNDDFTELTINCREGITWSDGEDFDCEDVVYTLNTLKDLMEQVRWGRDVDEAMDDAELVDKYTAKVNLLRPDPRFFFRLLTYKFDIGVYIVPEHHYRGRDWFAFGDYDREKGWPLSTGPWQVTTSTEQKVFDRRDSWWGENIADLGPYAQLPEIKKIIYIPGVPQEQRAQALIHDQVDYSALTSPVLIRETLDENPDLLTHSGRGVPYGYVDWWPVSIAFNTSGRFGPYDNPDVRWAFSFYLDREELRDLAYDGAAAFNPLTMPQFPPLQPYFDIAAEVMEEIGRSTLDYDPDRGDQLLEDAGFTKNADGMWADERGDTIDCEIVGFGAWADLGPAVAYQLKNHGINASYGQPTDASRRLAEGDFECLMFGHGGSVRDPYSTMKLYQSSSVNIPGGYQVNFYHWENPDWDELTDEVSKTDPNDTETMHALWRAAVKIWLEELPDVPLLEFYHRIVFSEKRWTNWPQGDRSKGPIDVTGYVNEASWHLTWSLVIHQLEKAGG